MDSIRLPALPRSNEWHSAITARTSRRRFDGRALDPAAAERVREACALVWDAVGGHARAIVVESPPERVFKGFVGSYGVVEGAPAYVVFVGGPDRHFEVGYAGEGVVLAAAASGVGTCWIAGSFDKRAAAAHIDLADGEQVYGATPLGYATSEPRGAERVLQTIVKPRRRVDLETIAPGVASWPEWAREATEAVRLAPSGANRQPWRLRMDGDALVMSRAGGSYWTAAIDCGIAALHAELGALHAGVAGSWEKLDEPDVAVFTPAASTRGV